MSNANSQNSQNSGMSSESGSGIKFNASVFISEQLNSLLVNAAQDLAQRAISKCAEHYNFDGLEAIKLLGLSDVKVERKPPSDVNKAKEQDKRTRQKTKTKDEDKR